MQILGLTEIQHNAAILAHSIAHEDYTIITKHGQPLGVSVSFDSHILDGGLRESISLKAYENGMISLGKLAQIIQLTKTDTMQLLNRLGICIADYDLDDELNTLENL